MSILKRNLYVPSPAEDAVINAGIADDADTYALSNVELKQLKPMRGRPVGSKAARTKVVMSMRVDAEVLEHLKSQGRGWQTRINNALKVLIAEHKL
jgi:uncharacterized protein (DUF4415 family)